MTFQFQIAPYAIGLTLILFAAFGFIIFLQINRIEGLLKDIESRLKKGQRSPAVRIVLALPTITKGGISMPNLEILNDTVVTIPIQTQDAEGVVVPAPSGDIFTAASSAPNSLGAAISGTNLVLTPLVQASPGITVTVTDSSGLVSATQVCDIVADLTPKNIVLDIAAETTAPQPVPTNPGP